MSDTPRTDRNYIRGFEALSSHTLDEDQWVRADFARQLERELNAEKLRVSRIGVQLVGLEAKITAVTRELTGARKAKDGAYFERNQVVSALSKCFPAGIARTAIEGWSEDWHGCVYIDLPTGQVSWHFHDSQEYLFAHLPLYRGKWDGHDTPEKYRRLAAMASDPPAS